MGNTGVWILAAIVYGLMCGGVYTWTSSRRVGSLRLFVRSAAVFTLLGLLIVVVLFKLL